METIKDFLNNLNNSDIIQLVGIMVALATSIVSIIISVATLHQNSKMIKENIRPYITVTFDFFQFGSPMGYFVIKNYGQTQAIINSLQCNSELMNYNQPYGNVSKFVQKAQGTVIAPNQKLMIPFHIQEFEYDKATFDICYSNRKDKYKEHYDIAISNYKDYFKTRIASNNLEKNIAYSLQEIAERLM